MMVMSSVVDVVENCLGLRSEGEKVAWSGNRSWQFDYTVVEWLCRIAFTLV